MSRSTPRSRLPAALLLLLGLSAAGAPAPATQTRRIDPDDGFEVCQSMTAGQSLHYRFESTLPLIFAVHYHQDQDARTLWRKDELKREEGDIRAAVAARYCLYWNNYQTSTLLLAYLVEVHN